MIYFRYGRLNKDGELGPGRVSYIVVVDEVVVVSKQDEQEIIPLLTILSIDAVSYTIKVTITYQVFDVVQAVTSVMDYKNALKLICGCLVRDACGFRTFDTVRTNQKEIEKDIEKDLAIITQSWGISVIHVALSDFKVVPTLLKAEKFN